MRRVLLIFAGGERAKRVPSVDSLARHFKDMPSSFNMKDLPSPTCFYITHTLPLQRDVALFSFLTAASFFNPIPIDCAQYLLLVIMMKCAAILALAGSAAAFAPTQQAGRMSTSVGATAAQRDFFGLKETMDFSKELGVQAPVST